MNGLVKPTCTAEGCGHRSLLTGWHTPVCRNHTRPAHGELMVNGSVLREFCSGTCSLFLKFFPRATSVCYNRVGGRFCWQMPCFCVPSLQQVSVVPLEKWLETKPSSLNHLFHICPEDLLTCAVNGESLPKGLSSRLIFSLIFKIM